MIYFILFLYFHDFYILFIHLSLDGHEVLLSFLLFPFLAVTMMQRTHHSIGLRPRQVCLPALKAKLQPWEKQSLCCWTLKRLCILHAGIHVLYSPVSCVLPLLLLPWQYFIFFCCFLIWQELMWNHTSLVLDLCSSITGKVKHHVVDYYDFSLLLSECFYFLFFYPLICLCIIVVCRSVHILLSALAWSHAVFSQMKVLNADVVILTLFSFYEFYICV